MRIGVFVCHCGSNIADNVDVAQAAQAVLLYPEVTFATDIMYACSEAGQSGIEQAVQEHSLDGVVMASCTPRMHEPTFRRAVERAGLNRYMFEMVNIREHASWISKDKDKNTQKTKDLIRMAVEKLRQNSALIPKYFEINKRVLIIGAGIAGIQAALDCAEGGLEVLLLEKEPSIGGKMAKLDKTFPTIDCSSCILSPKMVDVSLHPNITLYAYSELEQLSGYVGNYQATIRRKATYVDWDKCTGCGLCLEKCPSKKARDYFNEDLFRTTAINIPFPQAIPKRAKIDANYCFKLLKGKCGNCAEVCPSQAIDFEMQDQLITAEVGAVIAATGFDLFDHSKYGEYGGGRYKDVITSMQYERLLNASGPTGGHIQRPSDGKEPRKIVFVQCVGSRDKSVDRPYCSGFCCMYTAKQAILTKDHLPESECFVFYMDIRAPGKQYDEFTRRAMEEYGTRYVRGRVAQIYPYGESLMVRGVDTLLSCQVEVEADLVVLAVGAECSRDAFALAEKLRISADQYGFFMESHPKLRPVETNTAGIYLAGACQGPKDIPSSVGQGSAAASKILALFSKDMLESDPQVAQVNLLRCIGCGKCIQICPFGAIQEVQDRAKQPKAKVIETVCQGCGLCTVTCPQSAIELNHFTDNQILAEINALCQPRTEESFE